MPQICIGPGGLLHCVAKGSVVTWNILDKRNVHEISDIFVPGITSDHCGEILVHPDGSYIYVAGQKDKAEEPASVHIFSLASEGLVQSLSGHSRRISGLLWAAGYGLISSSDDGTCRLWDAEGHGVEIYDVGRRLKPSFEDERPEKIKEIAVDGNTLWVATEAGGIDAVDLNGSMTSRPLLPLWSERYARDVPQSDEANVGPANHDGTHDVHDKRLLAKKKGTNYVLYMTSLGKSVVAAGTVAGEVVLVKPTGYESLVAFTKGFISGIQSGMVGEECQLFVGPRSMELSKSEVVVLGTTPLRQLHRIALEAKEAVHHLLWCPKVDVLLVAQDDTGLFSVRPGVDTSPQTVYIPEEDEDTMDNEGILGFAQHDGYVYVRTTFGRVRNFSVDDGFQEAAPLQPVAQFGIKGRGKICYDRSNGTLISAKTGYSDYKIETAKPGDKAWRSHRSFPLVDGSAEIQVVKGGEPDTGMGYPGMYKVKTVPAIVPEVLTVMISVLLDATEVRINNLTGLELMQRRFPADADILQLQILIREQRPQWESLCLLSNDCTEVPTTDYLRNHDTLTVKGFIQENGKESMVKLEEIGGLMLVHKGWSPQFVEYLETPAESKVIVGGELGGLIEWIEEPGGAPFTAVGFQGGKLVTGCCTSLGVVSACAAWDAEGALILAKSRSQSGWVYHWDTRTYHGEIKCNKIMQPTRVKNDGSRFCAHVAAWDGETRALAVFDLRALVLVFRISLLQGHAPSCLLGAPGSRFFVSLKSDPKAPKCHLAAWALDGVETQEDVVPVTSSPQLNIGESEPVTSMLLVPHVGLLTAHTHVLDGISVWNPDTGQRLQSIWPTRRGTSIFIRPGPKEDCILWSAINGRVGFLRWNALKTQSQSHAEDGLPHESTE